ncbi:MAG TPA: transcription elongation factor GreB [Gammaproteobacteria bacterium]|nr:transcription elongation factor GreB [Gammaproteobacteria bacterium]
MGRWRPPAARASPYITAEGYRRLEAELAELWKRRAEVTAALSAAAAEGDRSENAEYIYRKKELRELDRRIRYLQKRLPDLHVVTESTRERSRVFFGAWVRLEDKAGHETEYRIVGPDELDPARGDISMDSPLARALLGKSLDDEIRFKAPGGETLYYITGVRYV